MKNLVDARTLAKYFGVKVDTVRTWTRQKRIPCVRPTRATVRYSVEAVERALVQSSAEKDTKA